jgi:hypothetical protein
MSFATIGAAWGRREIIITSDYKMEETACPGTISMYAATIGRCQNARQQ